MTVSALGSQFPQYSESVYIASDAQVIGNVQIGARSSVWFQCVLRGDSDRIFIGEESNVQDASIGHVDPGFPLEIGNRVTIGHRCLLHGCTIEDDCLIGMGAILMNEVRIGTGSIVGAGSLLLEGTVVPPFSLMVGSPAKLRKTYDPEILETIRRVSDGYVQRAQRYQSEWRTLPDQAL